MQTPYSNINRIQTARNLRAVCICAFLAVVLLLLFVADMMVGSVEVSAAQVVGALFGGDCPPMLRRIIIDIRLLKAVVALLAGAALSVSGLQMQTVFRNPLAGPYVLGISGGASLGVALLVLGTPVFGAANVGSQLGIAGAAWLGSAVVLSVIALAARRINDIMAILILGMMFSSGVGAVVQILQYLSQEQSLKAYVIWTMGSLGEVTSTQLTLLLPAVLLGLVLAVLAVKPMNIMMAGEEAARSLGLNLKRWRMVLFASTTLLAGSVTAFCGPIGFIGLAMPHIARMFCGTGNQRLLMPATLLTGSVAMIFCDIISKLFTLPINAITALLGIPVVMWIVVRR